MFFDLAINLGAQGSQQSAVCPRLCCCENSAGVQYVWLQVLSNLLFFLRYSRRTLDYSYIYDPHHENKIHSPCHYSLSSRSTFASMQGFFECI